MKIGPLGIHWTPIDDFDEGPKVFIFRIQWYINIFFRIRPFYLRVKVWFTRDKLIRDFRKVLADPKRMWTDDDIRIGSL